MELFMPVVECSCGMVMSTARDTRQRCFRCGSIALRELSDGKAMLPMLWRFMNPPELDATLQPAVRRHDAWTTETIAEGSHI
jgi:hypothetical protein